MVRRPAVPHAAHARMLWLVAPGWATVGMGCAVTGYATAAHAAGRHGAVTLLVTHRFSTAAADTVVVLHEGSIAETGSHADLITAGGHYAGLYNLQATGYR